MSKLTWTKFSGIRPRVDDRLLPDGNAQVADNAFFERGGLYSMKGTALVTTLAKVGVQSIYRFGQALNSSTTHWFHWTADVNVVKGSIAGDTDERTYWTGDGVPKYTFGTIAVPGANLPLASRPLGVPAPTAPPTLAEFVIAPSTTTGQETRSYIYTFKTDKGEESAPSLPQNITIQAGQGVTLSALQTTASNGAVLATKCIYRNSRGKYLFVAEIPIGNLTYNDTVANDQLGEVCPSIDWDAPAAAMFGLTGGPNGFMAAANGNDATFCEPYHPHAWPAKYTRALEFPIVGIGQFGQSFVFLTTGLPAVLTGIHPGNLAQDTPKFFQPCVSKRSIVSNGDDVLYASPDGLCAIGASGARILTEGLFLPEDWRVLNPSTILGAWHEGYYVGFYNPGSGTRGFMFNPTTQEWIDLPALAATAVYRDTVTDALYICVADAVHKWRAGAALSKTWKSNEVVTPLMDYVVARVTGDYPVTFKLYKAGVVKLTKTVNSDEPFKLPAGLARSWAVEASGTGAVLGIVLATSEQEA
jgi:hypothetical protein